MRVWLAVLAAICLPLTVTAQSLPIHGGLVKTGKDAYASPAEWLTFDAQGHWVPGDGSPVVDPPNTLTHDMAHTHVGVTCPLWAELTGPITCTVSDKLFHTAGKITQVWAFYSGPCGQGTIPLTMNGPLPVGQPLSGSPVSVSGTFVVDPHAGLSVCTPKHGWFQVLVAARTIYDNKDVLDVQNVTSYFSMIDPTAPEPPDGEATHPLVTAKTSAQAHNSTTVNVYGTQLVEFRYQFPLFRTITTPTTFSNFSYAYGYDHNLPNGSYELDVDPDLHMGVAGTPLTFKSSVVAGGSLNNDLLDPVAIALSTAPAGYPAGRHKLLAAWVQPTGTAPIQGATGGTIAPHLLLKTLMAFDITVAPTNTTPICTDPTASNYGGPLPCIPVPPPPPPPPPSDRCTGLVGQTGLVMISGVPFKVTVTSTLCAATVAVQ